jgi:tetratricopeptide (TPR) repeat protein
MYYGYSLNDLEEAIRRSRQFLQIYPDVGESWTTLCNLLTQLGQYSQAVDAGERDCYETKPSLARRKSAFSINRTDVGL